MLLTGNRGVGPLWTAYHVVVLIGGREGSKSNWLPTPLVFIPAFIPPGCISHSQTKELIMCTDSWFDDGGSIEAPPSQHHLLGKIGVNVVNWRRCW